MARLVALTQRVEVHAQYGERRDALDQRWTALLSRIGCVPLLLPNDREAVAALFERSPPAAVILTGGGDITSLGGDCPERDAVEHFLIAHCRAHSRPILGVCRGFQALLASSGTPLAQCVGHVRTRHDLELLGVHRSVNSFHNYAAFSVPHEWMPLACMPDGAVEFAVHRHAHVAGVMWHPERETPFDPADLAFIANLFDPHASWPPAGAREIRMEHPDSP